MLEGHQTAADEKRIVKILFFCAALLLITMITGFIISGEAEEGMKYQIEENPEESGEEKKALKPIDRIVQYIAEITQEATEAKPISDKELAEKLKRRLDLDIDLIRPSVSNDDIEETGVWQVVVGKQFAASVTFDARFIYYFQLEESRKYFLVFRS